MYGYVRTYAPELKVREQEYYRAVYCGLCRTMGKCTGQCSRMTLSYDIVFLAAVRCYLAGETPEVKRIRCLVHPLRRRKAVVNSPQLAYCADASALLAYHKLRDDRADEKGFQRLWALLGMGYLSSAYKRARRRHPALDETVKKALGQLSAYEKTPPPHSADAAAEIFGGLMQAVFAEGLDGVPARLAAKIGGALGRWIYLLDAADDLAEDRKKKRFNPFSERFSASPTAEDTNTLRVALTAILCEAEQAYLLMDEPPCPELKEIVGNILYMGLPRAAENVLKKEFQTDSNDSVKEQADE